MQFAPLRNGHCSAIVFHDKTVVYNRGSQISNKTEMPNVGKGTHKRALRILLNDHTSTFNELLVFYGFPEKGSETWEESRQLLEKHFKTCGLEAVDIDRAHRANTRNNSNDRGKARPIFAEFVTWQDSSYILQNASKLSKFPKSHGSKVKTSGNIHIQQLYDKKTVEERNKMLKIRKFFLLTNPDWKVSLTYPAILHINKGFGFKRYEFDEIDLQNAEDYFDNINNSPE